MSEGRPPGWAARLESSPLAIAGVIAFTAIGAVVGAMVYMDRRIDDRVALLMSAKLGEALGQRETISRLLAAEENAVTSQLAAGRQEDAAFEAFQRAERLSESARAKAEEMRVKVAALEALADVANLGAQIDAAIASPSFRDAVIERVLPGGAVIAFTRSDGCPDGWVEYLPAAGRTIVGAGPHSNLDVSGTPLSIHAYAAVGGEELHTLTVDEMAPHHHNSATVDLLPKSEVTWTTTEGDFRVGEPRVRTDAEITAQGGGKAHNNMPPFIALYFCSSS
jgi:hypothetical protein